MKTVVHRASERGMGEHGWLHTRHSFSFADWYDPERMGFGALRVINDDVVEPGSGFGKHHHADMEIITIVTEGAVTHRDSMGNAGQVRAGEVQVMSAGTGVIHAEENVSPYQRLSLFQIWIEPKERGVSPRYDQRELGVSTPNAFDLFVGPKDSGAPLWIHEDAYVSRVVFETGKSATYTIRGEDHGAYVFVIDGEIEVEGETLGPRDAIGIEDAAHFSIQAKKEAHVILFDVPMIE